MNILGLDPNKPPRKEEEEVSLVFKALFMDEIVSLDDSDDDSIKAMYDEIDETPDHVVAIENKQVDEIIELSDEENEVDRNWKEKLSQKKTSSSPPPFKEQQGGQLEMFNNISPPASSCSSSSDNSKEPSPIPEAPLAPELHSEAIQTRPCIVQLKKLDDDFIDNFNKEIKRRNSSSSSKDGNKSSDLTRLSKQRDSTSKSSRNSKEDKKCRKKGVSKHRKSSNDSSDNNNNISRKVLPTLIKNKKETLKNLERINSIVDPDTSDDEKLMPDEVYEKTTSKKKGESMQSNKRVIGSDDDELECVKTSNPSKILIRRKSVSEAGEPKKFKEIKKNDQASSSTSTKTLQCIAQYKIPMKASNKGDKKIAESASGSSSKVVDPYEFNDSSNSPVEAKKQRKMPARRMTICMGDESPRNRFQSKPVPIIDAPMMPKRRQSVYDPNPKPKAPPKRRLSTFEPNVSKKRRNSVFESNKGEFDMFTKATDLRNNSKKPPPRRISTDEFLSREEDKRRKELRKEKLREITEKKCAQVTAASTQQKQKQDQEETKDQPPKVQTKEQLEVIAAKLKTKYTSHNRGAFLAALEPAAATKPPMKLPVASNSASDAANNNMDRIANENLIKSFRQKHVRIGIVNATVQNGISEDVEFKQIDEELNRKILHRRDTVELPTPEESDDRIGFYNQIHFSQVPNDPQPAPQPLQMLNFPVSILKGPSHTRRRVNRSVSFKEELVTTKNYERDEPDDNSYHFGNVYSQENVAHRPRFNRRVSEPNPPMFNQMNFDPLHHQLQVNAANNAFQNMTEFGRNFDNFRPPFSNLKSAYID